MNNQTNNKIIIAIMILLGSVMVASAGSFNVDFYLSYNDYDYAPYQADFGMEYYDMNTMLMPYGHWVVIAQIGRVWIPNVYNTWRPYYHGHWVYTSYGPTWVAYEPWGWMTHHYGRWFYYPHYGWVWLPGYEWGPAWVSWRVYGTTIAWIPTPPHHYRYYDNDYYWDYDRGDRHYYQNDRYDGYRQNSLKRSLYVSVEARDFAKTNVDKYVRMNDANYRGNRISKNAPERYFIETKAKQKIDIVKMERKNFRVDGKQIEYLNPDGQLHKVITESKAVTKEFKPEAVTTSKTGEKRFRVENDKIVREKPVYRNNTTGISKKTMPVENHQINKNGTTEIPKKPMTIENKKVEPKRNEIPVYKTNTYEKSTTKNNNTISTSTIRTNPAGNDYAKKTMTKQAPAKEPVYRNNGGTTNTNISNSSGEKNKKVEASTINKKVVIKENTAEKNKSETKKSTSGTTTNTKQASGEKIKAVRR